MKNRVFENFNFHGEDRHWSWSYTYQRVLAFHVRDGLLLCH